jgi:putative membrane protein
LSTGSSAEWRRTSPLSAIFYLGKIYQDIAKNLLPSIAPLAALMVASQGNVFEKVVFGVSVFLIVTIVGAILKYWFFRFRITENSVLIREGVLRKTQLDIKFDRIQGITTQQNIVFRYFGLVTIKLDTAGSAKQEGNLPAVKMAFAESLKDRIRQETRTGKRDSSPEGKEADSDPGEKPHRTLLNLGGFDMVRIGLSSNRALILLVLLGPFLDKSGQDVEEGVDENTVQAVVLGAQSDVGLGVGLVMLAIVGFLTFLVLASIAGAFLSYHNFKLIADENVLRSTGGLLTRHEHSVNFAKIQSVVINQNIVLRIFGRYRMRARQASSGKSAQAKSFTIPLCKKDDLPMLTREIFGDEFPGVILDPNDSGFRPVDKRYVRSRVLLTGLLPATAIATLVAIPAGLPALVLLLWIPINFLIVRRRYKRFGVRVTPDGMAVRRGFVGYRVTTFLHRKIQRINVTQTATQKRKGLATLRFFLASGTVKVPYIDFNQAKQLRDFALYKIESSALAWH